MVLGVPLTPLTAAEAVARGVRGGLILAPSGPGLCTLADDPIYRDALLSADVNLTDSSFVILVRLLRGHRPVTRTSGLRYLEGLLRHPAVQSPGTTYWVMPSPESMAKNLVWLNRDHARVSPDDCYIAPSYPRHGEVLDPVLLAQLEQLRPPHVFLCVGSGVQEKLGAYLKRNLSYDPGIHCIGAAIAFLSGDQAPVPMWADRLGLGWLVRCVRDPKVYVPRYARAFKLAYLVLRYDESPPRS